MIDVRQIALDIIARNPNIANNPRSKAMIDILKSGDQQKGEELARNLCSSYGTTPDQATKDARAFFHL